MQPSPADFLAEYARRINTHDFDQVAPLIAADATFWFSDGSFTGREAIRGAFERTWAAIQEETYWVDGVKWLSQDDHSAACIYSFHWRGQVGGALRAGSGRGTTVLRKGPQGWQIVHEHLSRQPG